MKSLRLMALAALLGCASAKVAPPPKAELKPAAQMAAPVELPPAQLYAGAREKMAAKDYPAARAGLERYLQKEPNSAAGHFDAGWVAEQLGDKEAARTHYIKALHAEPEHLGAALNLVTLDKQAERYDEAAQLLQAALSRREGDARLLNQLASVQRLQKKDGEAEKTVQRILLRHPQDSAAYENLALIEEGRGHVRLAEAALGIARKLDPKDPGIVNNLGLLAMKRDDVAAARDYFLQARQLSASFAPAWANLGGIALRYRDYKAAADAYARATELEPQRVELHLAYGWALEGQKKPKEARAQYEQVLAARADDADALYGRAAALKAEGNLPEAMKAFQAYLSLPGAAKAKDAQSQIAQIDLRLKSAAPAAKAEPARREQKAGGADLSALPQSSEEEAAAASAPALELPADEPGIPATQPAERKPEETKPDEGDQKPAQSSRPGQTGGSRELNAEKIQAAK